MKSNFNETKDLQQHNEYMKRAITLSRKGIGYVNPNPLVGAVIVKHGEIIGEGYHEKIGENHAEINALNSCKESPQDATMYVTLEPCSHYGRTPPCVEAIIKAGIKEVIIGLIDPNPRVSSKGVDRLRKNNIKVITGVCVDEIRELNRTFIKYITTKKPYCIMKTAMTLDGKIASVTGDSKWISCEKSREYVHRIRHEMKAIMVGIGTILEDNPNLTTRLSNIKGIDPIRIIVDTKCRIPLDANVITAKGETIIATTNDAPLEKVNSLMEKGVKVIYVNKKNNMVDIEQLIGKLGQMEIDSILLEGGSKLNYSCLVAGIIDEIITFISPKIIGGSKAKTSIGGMGIPLMQDAYMLEDISIDTIDRDIVVKGKVIGKKV